MSSIGTDENNKRWCRRNHRASPGSAGTGPGNRLPVRVDGVTEVGVRRSQVFRVEPQAEGREQSPERGPDQVEHLVSFRGGRVRRWDTARVGVAPIGEGAWGQGHACPYCLPSEQIYTDGFKWSREGSHLPLGQALQ